ncbi:MAG: hypothetical protein K6E87_05060 [bacterium]|nr:hypothetical protein [bacterium]
MRKKEIDNYFNFDYKTKDIDLFIKKNFDKNSDVSNLREYVYGSLLYYRIYFKVSLMKFKTNKEKLDFVENNLNLFSDWWSTDLIGQFLKKPLDFSDHFNRAKKYVKSTNEFTKRFAYVLFINELAKDKNNHKDILSLIENDDRYYVKMAIAWLLCEMLAYNDDIKEYIKESSLNIDIKRMTINKVRDSFKIKDDVKQDLLNYRKENLK